MTDSEDRNYPIQRTEGRNEIEELSLRELWGNGKIRLNTGVVGATEGEEGEKGTECI